MVNKGVLIIGAIVGAVSIGTVALVAKKKAATTSSPSGAPGLTTIVLDYLIDQNNGSFSTLTFTAHALDQYGNPMADVPLTLHSIQRVMSFPMGKTNSSGIATLSTNMLDFGTVVFYAEQTNGTLKSNQVTLNL